MNKETKDNTTCAVCGKVFKTNKGLQIHDAHMHRPDPDAPAKTREEFLAKNENKIIEYRLHGEYVRAWTMNHVRYGQFEEIELARFNAFMEVAEKFDFIFEKLDMHEDSRWD